MCDVNAATTSLAALSGGVGLPGGLAAGFQKKQEADYDAGVATKNASILDMAAADAIARGDVAAQGVRLKGAQVEGAQRTGYAASGVDVNSGSAAGEQTQTAAMTELDAQTERNNAARAAWGYAVEASNERDKAAMLRRKGQMSIAAGALGGIGSGFQFLSSKKVV
jgi:hypothetical protein